jgi:hypothetical protein
MRVAFILAAGLAATACGPSGGAQNSSGGPPQMRDEAVSLAARPQAPAAAAPAPAASPLPVTVPQLAYRYDYRITASPKGVRSLQAAHEAACSAAGPAQCQVVSSAVDEMGEDRLRATLSFRATPGWLKSFRDRLDGQAAAAGGRVSEARVSSEDLSRQLVDTEAALRAKTMLRDRMEQLLATRPGKLSELVELEQSLAQVQGEIDATNSELTMMRARVAMSDVSIDYQSSGVLAPAGAWSPVNNALGDVADILAGTLGFMIRVVAILAPWALLIGGVAWLFRKRLPKLRRKAAAPPEA